MQAIPTTIKATSRASVKIGDNYFTVEYSEERMLPQVEEIQSTDIQGNKTSKIIYYKPCLEWMHTLPSIEGTIKSGPFNKIDLNVTNSFLRFSYGIDGYSGHVKF